MAMNGEAPSQHGFSSEALHQRVAAVEDRLVALEKAMLVAEFAALRASIRRISFETAMWIAAVFCIAAAITTTAYHIWFR